MRCGEDAQTDPLGKRVARKSVDDLMHPDVPKAREVPAAA